MLSPVWVESRNGNSCVLQYPCQRINYRGSKNQIKHIEAVETATVARLQKYHGIDLKKKKRKPNPAARQNEDLDSDHEPDWA